MIIGAPWIVTESLIKQFNIDLVVEGTMTKLKENEHTFNGVDPYAAAKKLGIY